MIKLVKDLTGPALDWAVLRTAHQPNKIDIAEFSNGPGLAAIFKRGHMAPSFNSKRWYPSTNWAQGGPIIEKAGISIEQIIPYNWKAGLYHKINVKDMSIQFGSTALIAAMRCYVYGVLGSEVDIPEELL